MQRPPTKIPAQLYDIPIPRQRDVRDRIWTESFMDTTPRNVVYSLGMSLKSIVKEVEDARNEQRANNAYLLLAALSLDEMVLLEQLWGAPYIERIIGTQILTRKGEVLVKVTYNELALWDQAQARVRAKRASRMRPPSRQRILEGLDAIHPSVSNVEVLESMYEALCTAASQDDPTLLNRVIRHNLLFYQAVWGEYYVLILHSQQTPLSLSQRQTLAITAQEMRNHIDRIYERGPQQDDLHRIHIQIWVAQRILPKLRRHFQRMARELGISLDQPMQDDNSVTWRQRLDRLTQRPSIYEVMAYLQSLQRVNAPIGQQQPPGVMQTRVTWVYVFRQLIRYEFAGGKGHAPEEWISLAETLEHAAQTETVPESLAHIVGTLPAQHKLSLSERNVLQRAEHYCRRRARNQRQGGVQRSGQLANSSATRDLMRMRISDVVDLAYDYVRAYLSGANDTEQRRRIVDKHVNHMVEIVGNTDALYTQAAQRLIQCHMYSMIGNDTTSPTGQCTQWARGQCRMCNMPLCGHTDCTKHHICAYCSKHRKGKSKKTKHAKKHDKSP